MMKVFIAIRRERMRKINDFSGNTDNDNNNVTVVLRACDTSGLFYQLRLMAQGNIVSKTK